MESLDFVIDITENLEKQNIDYFLVALRKGKNGSKADVFYRMSDEQSVHDMCRVLEDLHDDIEPSDSKGGSKWPKLKTDAPKKPAVRQRNKKTAPRKKRPAKKAKPTNTKAAAPKRRGRPPKKKDDDK